MKVDIRIIPEREAPGLILEVPALTPQLEALAQRLSALDDGTLPAGGRVGFSPAVPALRAGGAAGQAHLCPDLPLGDRKSEKGHLPGSEAFRHHPDVPGRRDGVLCVPAIREKN